MSTKEKERGCGKIVKVDGELLQIALLKPGMSAMHMHDDCYHTCLCRIVVTFVGLNEKRAKGQVMIQRRLRLTLYMMMIVNNAVTHHHMTHTLFLLLTYLWY
jgi:hypothetical protein